MPGVRSVPFSSQLPLADAIPTSEVKLAGSEAAGVRSLMHSTGAGFFEMRIADYCSGAICNRPGSEIQLHVNVRGRVWLDAGHCSIAEADRFVQLQRRPEF